MFECAAGADLIGLSVSFFAFVYGHKISSLSELEILATFSHNTMYESQMKN